MTEPAWLSLDFLGRLRASAFLYAAPRRLHSPDSPIPHALRWVQRWDTADRPGLGLGESQKILTVLHGPQPRPKAGLARAGAECQASVIIFLPFSHLPQS